MEMRDGCASRLFRTLPFAGNVSWKDVGSCERISGAMRAALPAAAPEVCVGWGIPFEVHDPVVVAAEPAEIDLPDCRTRWLIFMHTSDVPPPEEAGKAWTRGLHPPMRGEGRLGELAARYVLVFENGLEVAVPIRRRFEIGDFTRSWGENCFACVPHHKPYPLRLEQDQAPPSWGRRQYRVEVADAGPWMTWLYAWENPRPELVIDRLGWSR